MARMGRWYCAETAITRSRSAVTMPPRVISCAGSHLVARAALSFGSRLSIAFFPGTTRAHYKGSFII